MDVMTVAMWSGTAVFLVISLAKDRKKQGRRSRWPLEWAGGCL